MKDILQNRIKRLPKKEFQDHIGKYYIYNGFIWNILRLFQYGDNIEVLALKINNNKTKRIIIDKKKFNNKCFFASKNELENYINKLNKQFKD